MRLDPNGKPTFIDHLSFPKKTTYEHPSKKKEEAKKAVTKEGEESLGGETETTTEDKTEKEVDDQRSCIICLENERCVALIPCGHLCLCRECSGTQKKCPICRTPIQDLLRTYSV